MKIKVLIKNAALCTLLFTIASCKNENKVVESTPVDLTQYVDPYIGTGDHGHVFLGANVPRGFVQLGPTQPTQGWDWCSGYHYTDSLIAGFSHLHLSGTGIGDLGDITFLPTVDDTRLHKFTHANEVVKPGYYAIKFPESGIKVELTATERCGYHKYLFPKTNQSKIIIDLKRGIGWDSPAEGYLVQENDSVVSGYRYSKGWAKFQQVYFTAVFSKSIKGFKVSEDDKAYNEGKTVTNKTAFAELSFDTTDGEVIYAKVGLSAVSIDNAKLNLKAELYESGLDFEQTIAYANHAWNEELNKITIKTNNETNKRVFYTALYHSLFAPSIFCDVNGDYRGSDGKVYKDAPFTNYTTFSLWDTYRAAHPLATIIHPEIMEDYAQTMLHIFNEQGKLPVWHLMGNETDCMVGNPGIPVLADMLLKGYDMDNEKALEAMKTSALLDERSLGLLKEYGYIPCDKEPTNETVAKALEYALADWSIAQVAKKLGKTEDYEYFLKRSKSYTNYFDKNTTFMRALSSDRKFKEPFDPFDAAHRVNDYTEGNAWQYVWLVPHDVYGLIDLFGSEAAFTAKLDSLFKVEGDMGEHASPDVSGLIGQYAHGNEPSHHILYLYPYVGQPWKTAEKVRQVLKELYFDAPAGLSGNEDVGQMSSWYILSALGFYQVAPAGGEYVFGSPLFDEALVEVGEGKTFKVVALNNSDQNMYIQSVKLNGKPYTKSYINFSDIMAGGTLEFTMGSAPSNTFGVNMEDRPHN
ncbi:GH92 family glycosyl hydrolase [Bacteroides sp. 519]|uniref:GH92 family glycosyl hydrolase n=1 Tax=Bacteroides sp. 519 TaxID=2302937 RepID=UPI0013D671AC|nr:GH92 family glycosyl hydrolase [Bacteroides sp. 519]NDV59990.1 glycoside hydrolase family 92 protein [Bacteroides sp. 519]